MNLKNNITQLILCCLSVFLFACQHKGETETLYVLYYGDRDVSFPDLVLKNDNNSYVDSIMPVGKPVEYLVSDKEFYNIKSRIQTHASFVETKDFSTGIMVIYYSGEKKKQRYLFTSAEVKELIDDIEANLEGENKANVSNWIKGVCKMKKIPY